jgi:hypothetical protein
LSDQPYTQTGILGTGINHFNSPQAALDVTVIDYAVPITRLRAAAYIFADEGHSTSLGGHHYKSMQVYNPNTGRVGGYKSEYLECINVVSGVATHNLGSAVGPDRGGGRVTIDVEGVVEADRTRLGSWTIVQQWKDDGGGPALIGLPISSLASTTDNAFVAPTIVISGGKFYAQITEHPTQVTDWSAVVTIRHAGA